MLLNSALNAVAFNPSTLQPLEVLIYKRTFNSVPTENNVLAHTSSHYFFSASVCPSNPEEILFLELHGFSIIHNALPSSSLEVNYNRRFALSPLTSLITKKAPYSSVVDCAYTLAQSFAVSLQKTLLNSLLRKDIQSFRYNTRFLKWLGESASKPQLLSVTSLDNTCVFIDATFQIANQIMKDLSTYLHNLISAETSLNSNWSTHLELTG